MWGCRATIIHALGFGNIKCKIVYLSETAHVQGLYSLH